MTTDPLTAALDQLAACRATLTALDTREAAHYRDLKDETTELTSLVPAGAR